MKCDICESFFVPEGSVGRSVWHASCGKTINLSHVANAWDPKTFATSLICGRVPYPYPPPHSHRSLLACWLAGLSAYWYAALSGSAPVASHHQLSGRTVSNNIFLDTIFGDCMPRITCHKLGAGESCSNNCLAVAACKMLAPTAYREWCSGRHLSDLASQSLRPSCCGCSKDLIKSVCPGRVMRYNWIPAAAQPPSIGKTIHSNRLVSRFKSRKDA